MTYSKRWELTHLLGGKCVDCGNENFYELEIDHINNDGDGERKYYSTPFKKHLRQPERAKERLEVRCKTCHEKRHHPTTFYDIVQQRHRRYSLFISTLKELETENKNPVKEEDFVEALSKEMHPEQATQFIRKTLREASIYESARGCYNTV